MVLGDLPEVDMAATALEVAAAHGWPVLAEPFGARAATPAAASTLLPHGPLVLLNDELVGSAPPQRVLTVGRNTLHREVSALTRRPDVVVEQVTASARWSDPSHQAARVYRWADFVQSAHEPADPAWTHRWLEAGEDLTRRLAALATEEMCGVNVAATVLQAVTGSDTVVLGSSNVPRDVSLADTGGEAGRTVVGNRGLAGIDGTVSTAVGVALASSGRVLALMGDLTFQHDANGMLIGPWEPQPDVTVVVCNDDGGGIFATLEYGAPEHSAVFRRLFATPTQTSIGMLCAAHGVPHVAVGSLDELRAVLRAPSTGLRVVEVPVDPVVDRRERSAWRSGASRPH
jgi:2-succinyl-5-enolpyruvyl-6-hydroxy-3-cyclohexene-1-carboxylate synthase